MSEGKEGWEARTPGQAPLCDGENHADDGYRLPVRMNLQGNTSSVVIHVLAMQTRLNMIDLFHWLMGRPSPVGKR